MAKVIVTGAAGFIGMHTTARLTEAGHEVSGIDNLNDYYDVGLKLARLRNLGFSTDDIRYDKKLVTKEGCTFVQQNLEDREAISGLFAHTKPDYVIHLAAQAGVRYSLVNPYAYIDSNITGFLNILEACKANPVRHLVYASSSSVYGLNRNIPFSESGAADHPLSLYAATKKSNEMMAHTYAHLFHIPSSGLRFFTVYGPWGRPDMALFIFTKNILEGKPIEVFNQGNMIRDFTYVDDIVTGITGVLVNPPSTNPDFDPYAPVSSISSAPYAIYNIGNGSPVDLMDFIKAIEKKVDRKAKIMYRPIQPGDVPATHSDTSFLKEAIGYVPNTRIEDGIGRFVDWYREYFDI